MDAETTLPTKGGVTAPVEAPAEAPSRASGGTPGAPASAAAWAARTAMWPDAFTVKALYGNARFVGDVRIERVGHDVTITGKRVAPALYWGRFWLIGLFIGLLALPPFQESGVATIINVLSILALVTFGGRLLLHGMAKPESITFRPGPVAQPSVGLRVRGWHVLLVGFSGLAALVVFALYRGGRRTVSVQGDRGDGHLVRYLFMARDETQAIQLAALLIP